MGSVPLKFLPRKWGISSHASGCREDVERERGVGEPRTQGIGPALVYEELCGTPGGTGHPCAEAHAADRAPSTGVCVSRDIQTSPHPHALMREQGHPANTKGPRGPQRGLWSQKQLQHHCPSEVLLAGGRSGPSGTQGRCGVAPRGAPCRQQGRGQQALKHSSTSGGHCRPRVQEGDSTQGQNHGRAAPQERAREHSASEVLVPSSCPAPRTGRPSWAHWEGQGEDPPRKVDGPAERARAVHRAGRPAGRTASQAQGRWRGRSTRTGVLRPTAKPGPEAHTALPAALLNLLPWLYGWSVSMNRERPGRPTAFPARSPVPRPPPPRICVLPGSQGSPRPSRTRGTGRAALAAGQRVCSAARPRRPGAPTPAPC